MRFLLIFLLGIWGQGVAGQVTFNKRYDFGFLGALFTSMVTTDSCYYATGILADTLPPYVTANVMAKLDLDGEVVWAKTIIDLEKTYEMWFNNLVPFGDNRFICAGYTVDSLNRLLLVEYDDKGDTLSTDQYLNPGYPTTEFIQPRGGLVILDDGSYITSSWITHGITLDSDIYTIRHSPTGEILWGEIYGDQCLNMPSSLIPLKNGNIMVGGLNTDINSVLENFKSRIDLVEYNLDGDIVSIYHSPLEMGLLDAPNEIVEFDDGSLIIATGKGTEIERPTGNTIYFEKHILKLNPEKEIEWEITFEDMEPNSSSELTSIVKVADGSGFVVAGSEGEDLPGDNTYAVRGFLAKVSQNGAIAWKRSYVGIGGDRPRHSIYDIDETPDGGFIICGESRDGTNETLPPQQGWLLKLDKHGCLIPGCHLTDATDEKAHPELDLAIYPNPTSDYLNFQLRGSDFPKTANFRIVDVQGKTIKTFESRMPGETHIVPVWDWAPGVYFLQYVEKGEVRATEKFVVGQK